MTEEKISQEFGLKNIDETRKYFTEEIKRNKSIIKKHKTVSKILNFIEKLLVSASTVTECVSIFAFASLVSISADIASSAVGIQICAITAVIKKYVVNIIQVTWANFQLQAQKPKKNHLKNFFLYFFQKAVFLIFPDDWWTSRKMEKNLIP